MSTRTQVRFATREDGVSFSEHPDKINAQFYVHSDGYPERLGVEIAKSILDSEQLRGWEIEYLDTKRGDLEYIYYIWQTECKTTWISIFEVYTNSTYCGECGHFGPSKDEDKCIFVGDPQKLLERYDKERD